MIKKCTQLNLNWIKGQTNLREDMVLLKDILEDKNFKTNTSNLTFALGKNNDNEFVFDRLDEVKNILVVGSTGTGKSVFLQGLIVSLLSKTLLDNEFILIDPKLLELNTFDGLNNFNRACKFDDIYKALQNLKIEIQKRKEVKGEYKNTILIIDEVADLFYFDFDKYSPLIEFILKNGPDVGVYSIISTQVLNSEILKNTFLNLFKTKIAFNLKDEDASNSIGIKGAEKLNKAGKMLYLKNGVLQNLTSGFISYKDLDNIRQNLLLNE